MPNGRDRSEHPGSRIQPLLRGERRRSVCAISIVHRATSIMNISTSSGRKTKKQMWKTWQFQAWERNMFKKEKNGSRKPRTVLEWPKNSRRKNYHFVTRSSFIQPILFKTTAYISQDLSYYLLFSTTSYCSQDYGNSRSLESKRCFLLTFQVLTLFAPFISH